MRATGRDSIVPGIPDVAFVTLALPVGNLANVELSWLAPSKLRRTVIVGSEKMVVYDDGTPEPVRVFDHGVIYKDPETFGEYQLSYRTGDILSPKVETYEPLVKELEDFVQRGRERRRDGRQRRPGERRRSDHRGRRRLAPARRRRGRSDPRSLHPRPQWARHPMRSGTTNRPVPGQPIGAATPARRFARGGRREGPAAGWRAQVVAHRYAPRDAAVRRLLAISDLAGIAAALAIALLVFSYHSQEFLWGLVSLPVWIVVFKAYGLYDRDIKRISHGTTDDLPWLFHAVLVGSILLFGYYRLTPVESITLTSAAVFACTAFLATSGLRALSRRLAVAILGPERVLLIGGRREIEILGRKLGAHPEYGAKPVGIISPAAGAPEDASPPLLGRLDDLDLDAVVRNHRVERVVLAHQDFDDATLLDLLHRSRELGVKVNVLPQPFDALGPSVEVDDVEGITVLGINPPVLPRSSRFLKRAMDLVGSVALLVLAAPLMALIAVAIKLDSRGPVFFRQERIGRGGRRFRLVKFRTMAPGRGAAAGGAPRPEQGPRLAAPRPRSADHARRALSPPLESRRAAAALERRSRAR